MQKRAEAKIKRHLSFLYEREEAEQALQDILRKVAQFRERNPSLVPSPGNSYFTETDSVLIVYGDQLHSPGEPPLRTLAHFLERRTEDLFSIIHLLPFFPYSSDAGFSITDYRTVNPELGGWGDVERLARGFDLMVDAVINHASRESRWFSRYLEGNPEFQDFFIEVDEEWDLSQVVRPRETPLVTEIRVDGDQRKLWTTFSEDQIDLNFANPEVLVRIVDLLLFYVEKGASVIRLDAIALYDVTDN